MLSSLQPKRPGTRRMNGNGEPSSPLHGIQAQQRREQSTATGKDVPNTAYGKEDNERVKNNEEDTQSTDLRVELDEEEAAVAPDARSVNK